MFGVCNKSLLINLYCFLFFFFYKRKLLQIGKHQSQRTTGGDWFCLPHFWWHFCMLYVCLDETVLLSLLWFSVETAVIIQLCNHQLCMVDQEWFQTWILQRFLYFFKASISFLPQMGITGFPALSTLFKPEVHFGVLTSLIRLCSWDWRWLQRIQTQNKVTLGIPDKQETFVKGYPHIITSYLPGVAFQMIESGQLKRPQRLLAMQSEKGGGGYSTWI